MPTSAPGLPANPCGHARYDVRKLHCEGGSVQLRDQCLDCGWVSPTSRKLVNHPGWQAFSRVDNAARDRYDHSVADRVRLSFLERRGEEELEWLRAYHAYLASPGWQSIRRRVFVDRRGICEGCRADLMAGQPGWPTGFHVHHVHEAGAYRVGFGNERLFHLRLLCASCHAAIPTKFSGEE